MKKLLLVIAIIILFSIFNDDLDETSCDFKENNTIIYLYETVSKEEAIEDINQLVRLIDNNYIKAVHHIPFEFIYQAEDEIELINNLPNERITNLELWKAISRIFGELRASHAYVDINLEVYQDMLNYYVKFDDRKRELYLLDNDKRYNIVSINGQNIKDIHRNFIDTIGLETMENENFFFERAVVSICGLEFLGVDTRDGVTITYLNDELIETDKKLNIVTIEEYLGDSIYKDVISYEIDEENSVAVLELNSFATDYMLFDKVLFEFFTEVKNNNIDNIAIDLRNNGGGDRDFIEVFHKYVDWENFTLGTFAIRSSTERDRFIIEKDNPYVSIKNEDLLFTGNLYVLISNYSYSRSIYFADLVQHYNYGTIIGEIPRGLRDAEGIPDKYILENSGIVLHFSNIYYSSSTPALGTFKLVPDILIDSNLAIDKLYEVIK